jgi:dihydroorotate dehydrogenase
MLYRLAQKLLFCTDPEWAHGKSLGSLRLGHRMGLTGLFNKNLSLPSKCMGLTFPNPIGIAAGLDKNADYFEALGDLGFGFIEVGTVTPRPQPGNPKPRIFRLTESQAIINRLGFNNKGVDYLVEKVRDHKFKGVLGINIGKNFDTPIEQAAGDYLHCLEKVYAFADYVTINISSPNTKNLRTLQEVDSLNQLLGSIAEKRESLSEMHGRRIPIAVKVAPDIEDSAIPDIASVLVANEMDAVIATNTTVDRPGLEGVESAHELGGLSGRPLKPRSDAVLKSFRQNLPAEIGLIGVGGISSGEDAVEKLGCGADLVQFYTGFVFSGPGLLRECFDSISLYRDN